MKKIKSKIMIFFVLMTSILTAQPETSKDTTKIRHFTESSPDLPQQFKEYIELSKKYPNKSVWYPEDFGEQLTDLPKEELIRRLETSKDKIELRKIAQVLGDRDLAGTLKLTDSETAIVENKIRSYILATADFENVDYAEVHSQVMRFWHLALYELLRNLENNDPQVRAFCFNTLVQIRTENVVRIMINKAKVCTSPNIKNMYIGTLGIMTQQQPLGISNRETMNEKDSEELFKGLIEPALKELSPTTEQVSKN